MKAISTLVKRSLILLVAIMAISLYGQEYNLAEANQELSDEYSTGFDEQTNDVLTMKAYPNPVISVLTISGNKEILEICVFAVSGELLHKSYPDSKEYTIDFSQYKNGMYFLRATTSEMGVYTETIVKK